MNRYWKDCTWLPVEHEALNLWVKQPNFHLSSSHSLAWSNVLWTFHLWTNVCLKRPSVQHDHYCIVSETYHKGTGLFSPRETSGAQKGVHAPLSTPPLPGSSNHQLNWTSLDDPLEAEMTSRVRIRSWNFPEGIVAFWKREKTANCVVKILKQNYHTFKKN